MDLLPDSASQQQQQPNRDRYLTTRQLIRLAIEDILTGYTASSRERNVIEQLVNSASSDENNTTSSLLRAKQHQIENEMYQRREELRALGDRKLDIRALHRSKTDALLFRETDATPIEQTSTQSDQYIYMNYTSGMVASSVVSAGVALCRVAPSPLRLAFALVYRVFRFVAFLFQYRLKKQ